MDVAIIIPVYNEALNIEKNLDAIGQGLKGMPANFTVNIVYDREDDNTLPVIAKIRSRYPFALNLIKNPQRGVCNAIKTGLKEAKGDYVLVTMADMSDDYTTLQPMVEEAKKGFDIVCASRYMKGGRIHGGPFVKQLLSRLAGVSLHFLARIPTHDITNSYKLYRKSMLEDIVIESQGGFEIGLEITAKAFVQGYRITELPSQWWDRTAGKSNFKLFSWLPKYLKWYFYLIQKTWMPSKR